MAFLRIGLALGLCFLAACSAKRTKPNYDLPVACVHKVTMVRCDPDTDPLKCEHIAVTYVKGCEQQLPK